MSFRGSDDQRNLTPIQRQILDAERQRRAKAKKEEKERQMQQAQNGGGGPSRPLNSRGPSGGGASSGGNTQSETVRYVNTNENPEYKE